MRGGQDALQAAGDPREFGAQGYCCSSGSGITCGSTQTEVRRERLRCISPFCSHRHEQPLVGMVLVSPGSIESKNAEVSVGPAWARKARAGTGYRMRLFLFPFRLRTWLCVDANAVPMLLRMRMRTPKPMRTLRPTVAPIEPDVMGRCGRRNFTKHSPQIQSPGLVSRETNAGCPRRDLWEPRALTWHKRGNTPLLGQYRESLVVDEGISRLRASQPSIGRLMAYGRSSTVRGQSLGPWGLRPIVPCSFGTLGLPNLRAVSCPVHPITQSPRRRSWG